MKLAKRVAVALVLLLSMPGVAQAISVSQSSVALEAGRASVNLGSFVTLRGTLRTDHCHHHCEHHCHHHGDLHGDVTIFRNGVPAATVSTNASGRFSYSYTASDSSTWSAMFRGDRCQHHGEGDGRHIDLASVSRVVAVAVTLNGEAILPHARPRF